MSASRFTVQDLEAAVWFLKRTTVIGSADQELLIATVEALEAEIARRRRNHDQQ